MAESNGVFVGSLDWKTSVDDLRAHMSAACAAGEVVNATIFEDGKGKSKGSGLVQYRTAEQANYAISQLNETNLGSRNIIVREDRKGGGGGGGGKSGGGFGKGGGGGGFGKGGGYGKDGGFGGGFGGYGKGDGKGYGKDFGGGFGKSKGKGKDFGDRKGGKGKDDGVRANPEDQGRLVRVGNLPFSAQWQDLKTVFSQYGQVIRADIPMDEGGRSRGFGIVLFQNELDADTAINALNEQDFQGRSMKVRLYNIN